MGLPSSVMQTYLSQYLQQRKIPLLFQVNADAQEGITGSILALNLSSQEPIQLIIDSSGGTVRHGWWISDAIRCSDAPVDGLVVGAAWSTAFWILQNCRRRIAYPHATLLWHGFRYDAFTRMDSGQFNQEVRVVKQQQQEVIDLVIRRTKQSLSRWRRWSREERMFSATEALELGIIDEIVEPKPLPGM